MAKKVTFKRYEPTQVFLLTRIKADANRCTSGASRPIASESHTADKLHYNKQQDCYVCPIGQRTEKMWE